MSLLELEDVTTGYNDVSVLHDVTLAVDRNEAVGVIGPNGAGKSTVFKTIMGYLEPWSGTVRYGGEAIDDAKPSERVKLGIGYVPQRENVFPKMTVRENLRMGAYTLDSETYEGRIQELFDLFPRLEERADQKVRTMSGGEQKMVAIARAMVTNPDLVLFDEPSAGLMPKYISEIFERIADIQRERETAFLIIEQNVPIVLEHTDRTYALRNGSVVADRESSQFVEQDDLGELYLGGSTGGD
ncbi:ABC transporter ATP-binding protein [Natrarchaeobius oligotrophus]|uniref:ABC transporter ATP-binding protein n=1 Tax=Natrarchaeobius chitinivorans TaxID=1679083 RepID=A0A3N6MEN6_NATCH|nr:ABC transporter ATP-binding protein [Natrarchaeobius chitinivorans]RQH02454.1 ABC transporter ATP-binding protein [Natrarchaeobius chitinivorans]